MKKIFIITGEVSGDILASKIINYLDLKTIEVKGIVGSNLKEIGVEGPFENKEITFFGITDIIKNIFYIKKRIDKTVKYIESFKPDIVFSVDSPDFVFQVIKKIKQRKKMKTKFFHFVAPSIWAWREGRAKKIKNLIDKIYLLFKFEIKYFDKYGIKNQYVGHPFFENFIGSKLNFNTGGKLISFCPGSRKKEIHEFMPIFIDVIKNYKHTFNYHFATT
ncbi:MAG: lipid-A-disaccharide synthase, partial [Pelagibacteraceae bacterium]